MLTKTFTYVSIILLVLSAASTIIADDGEKSRNWDNFRGPTENGVSLTAKPPQEWSSSTNVRWKAELPGRGTSSPIVWGNRVFLTTAIPLTGNDSQAAPRDGLRQEIISRFDADGDGRLSEAEQQEARRFRRSQGQVGLVEHQFVVMCFDLQTGEKIWSDVAYTGRPFAGHHPDHGYASASPVTDGEHVFFHFGSYGLYCYDLSGKQIWKRTDLGQMQTRGGFGEGSSVTVYGKYLILPWDHEGPSRIEAIDKQTGKTIWKQERDEPSNWVTPRVVEVEGNLQVIQGGENFTRGYDLADGKEIWRASGLTSRPVASPVVRNKMAYFASARSGAALNAFYLDRRGDISDQIAWRIARQTPDCPSLLLSENRLFFISGNQGIVSCVNADTGVLFFGPQRLIGVNGVYSSPVAADGRVYVTGRNGRTVIIADDGNYQELAENDLGEGVDATLALVGNRILIRGSKHLFCICEDK